MPAIQSLSVTSLDVGRHLKWRRGTDTNHNIWWSCQTLQHEVYLSHRINSYIITEIITLCVKLKLVGNSQESTHAQKDETSPLSCSATVCNHAKLCLRRNCLLERYDKMNTTNELSCLYIRSALWAAGECHQRRGEPSSLVPFQTQ